MKHTHTHLIQSSGGQLDSRRRHTKVALLTSLKDIGHCVPVYTVVTSVGCRTVYETRDGGGSKLRNLQNANTQFINGLTKHLYLVMLIARFFKLLMYQFFIIS